MLKNGQTCESSHTHWQSSLRYDKVLKLLFWVLGVTLGRAWQKSHKPCTACTVHFVSCTVCTLQALQSTVMQCRVGYERGVVVELSKTYARIGTHPTFAPHCTIVKFTYIWNQPPHACTLSTSAPQSTTVKFEIISGLVSAATTHLHCSEAWKSTDYQHEHYNVHIS